MKKNIYIYMYNESLYCTAEINTTLYINHTSITFLKKDLPCLDTKAMLGKLMSIYLVSDFLIPIPKSCKDFEKTYEE